MLSKLIKRMLIITCCLLVGVGVVFVRWYVKRNLTEYVVYYAMHIEHSKGTHPDFAMVIDNMDTIKQPKVDKVVYRPDSAFRGHLAAEFIFITKPTPLMVKRRSSTWGMGMMMPISILTIEG